jgi:hypothetical protein
MHHLLKTQIPSFCYGGAIRSPKGGFWRPSEMSSNFLKCPKTESCVGDPYFLKEEETEDFKLVKANFITMSSEFFFGYCEKGYQGVLCAECENEYGIGPSYTCEDCSDWKVYLKQFLVIIIRSVLFWISLKKALGINEELAHNKGEITENRRNNMNNSYLLKILQEHFQHLMIFSFLPPSIPSNGTSGLNFVTLSSSNDIKTFFSLQCLQ